MGEVSLCQQSRWNNCSVWRSQSHRGLGLFWFGRSSNSRVSFPASIYVRDAAAQSTMKFFAWQNAACTIQKNQLPFLLLLNFATINLRRNQFAMFTSSNLVKVLMLIQGKSYGSRNGCTWKVNEYVVLHLWKNGFFNQVAQPWYVFHDTYAAVGIYC